MQSSEVPSYSLSKQAGWLKVIAGNFGELSSAIPSYTNQFIYHLHLERNKLFSLETSSEMEYAAFLPLEDGIINDQEYQKGELVYFKMEA